jgi:hypothetical protein
VWFLAEGEFLMGRSRWRGDPAVFYGFMWKGLQLLATPITMLLVIRFFDLELQGYYYTFLSLLALQSFFELGFYIVITNVAAHEWAHLTLSRDGVIQGDARAISRLVSLGRLVFRWYAFASAAFFVVVLIAGFALFSGSANPAIDWRTPWIVLVVIASLNLWAAPFSALLEGCDQVAQVHRYNFLQATISSLLGWVVIAAGGGLWTTVAIASGQLLALLGLLLVRYRAFFRVFFCVPARETISWRGEIWPLQWRLALSGLVSYFAFSLFNPVMYHYHGAETAGRMGMTLQIVFGLQMVAMIWIKTQVPNFGRLISLGRFSELERVWRTAAFRSAATYALLGIAVLTAVLVVANRRPGIAERVLPLDLIAAFLLAGIFMNVAQSFTAYLRAHKKEPILVMSVVTSLLIGLSVWLFGRALGPAGAAWSYSANLLLILLWGGAIWRRCRQEWHGTHGSVISSADPTHSIPSSRVGIGG